MTRFRQRSEKALMQQLTQAWVTLAATLSANSITCIPKQGFINQHTGTAPEGIQNVRRTQSAHAK